ncbi:MAG: glucose-6-phosphate dehydrogenase [Bifidobacteriaceae bacterium]|jgi:glucose-6-phosphate 1-dehydrogenase|nr:glucose-6-phosphate dehydrogenase [Bifidobacteriaceae bacterium]
MTADLPAALPVDPPVNPLVDPADERVPRIPPPCALTIFGVTGDLARRKVMPAIYDLANRGLLPAGFSLTGVARSDWTTAQFVGQAHAAVASGARTPFRQRVWEQLAASMTYVNGDIADPGTYERLRRVLEASDSDFGTGANRVFYLSMPPSTFATICDRLAGSGLARPPVAAKVVIEKPFGHDLGSARALDATLGRVFDPSSVFRIDHYLGKETVRGMLATRFANQVFEPLWSHEYVDHVQITMAEELGVGSRAGYYDGIGATRDVMQNHLLQLLAITAMDEPVSFGAADLRAAKLAVLAAVRLSGPPAECAVRGQYAAGWQGNIQVPGYLDEPGIPAGSKTDTFGALKLEVATDRWRDTPFYLRTGKRLGRRVTEVAITFSRTASQVRAGLDTRYLGANALVVRIQPDEGITLRVGAKVPQTDMEVRDVTMDFSYGHAFTESLPDAYERLILDVLLGYDPLFPGADEVDQSWRVIDPVEEHWSSLDGLPEAYAAGTWGPVAADDLLRRDGREWRRP